MSIDRCELADLLDVYVESRRALFREMLAKRALPGGPWSIRYTRDPSKADPAYPRRTIVRKALRAKLDGVPFDGIVTNTEIENFAPFTDFQLLDPCGNPPAEGTPAEIVRGRLDVLLDELLEGVRIITTELSSLPPTPAILRLLKAMPVFPYFDQLAGPWDAERALIGDVGIELRMPLPDPTPASTDIAVADPIATPARRGRLSKEESEIRRTALLATVREHPSLAKDFARLAQEVDVSESTVRRWMNEENGKYGQFIAANSDADDD